MFLNNIKCYNNLDKFYGTIIASEKGFVELKEINKLSTIKDNVKK